MKQTINGMAVDISSAAQFLRHGQIDASTIIVLVDDLPVPDVFDPVIEFVRAELTRLYELDKRSAILNKNK